ncbi:MAG: peptidylprolyl isomerase [Candidatus Wallbacteria bacterium]|nr:peptidylprolyl isomerase [Candidatus Wallbacteria bacterium]
MLIEFNGGALNPEEIIRLLSFSGLLERIVREAIRIKAGAAEARSRGITVTDQELQKFADDYRFSRGLQDAEETMAFLKKSGLTMDGFEELCESFLLVGKLQESIVTDQDVEDYFFSHLGQFDAAMVSRILVRSESLAQEILMQAKEDGADFHLLAARHSVERNTANHGGYAGMVSRADFPLGFSTRVFSASAGEILGPEPVDDQFLLLLVESVRKAELNLEIKTLIREILFEDWISLKNHEIRISSRET